MPQEPAKSEDGKDEQPKIAVSKVKVSSKNSFRVSLSNSIKALTKHKKIDTTGTQQMVNMGTGTRPSTPSIACVKETKELKRRTSIFRRPSWRKFTHSISRFAQQMTAPVGHVSILDHFFVFSQNMNMPRPKFSRKIPTLSLIKSFY